MRRRVAIVTGSESGIGRATAVALARDGCDVGVTWHRSEADGRETVGLVEAEGSGAALAWLDLGEPDAAGVVDRLADELGGVDVLVNNAAESLIKPALETQPDEFRRIVEVDLVAQFLLAQAAARRMVAAGRGGRIVNVTSVNGRVGFRNGVAYAAAKHGLEGLTRTLAVEWAPHGITVNAVAPGPILTHHLFGDDFGERAGTRMWNVPLDRAGEPDEVARTIVHLAAPDAAFVTGASWAIDGGIGAYMPTGSERPDLPPFFRRVRLRLRRLAGG